MIEKMGGFYVVIINVTCMDFSTLYLRIGKVGNGAYGGKWLGWWGRGSFRRDLSIGHVVEEGRGVKD